MRPIRYVVPRPRPWPFLNDRGPESEAEFEILDKRFVGWLDDFVSDSLAFLDERLSDLPIPPQTAKEIIDDIRLGLLSEWARSVISLDDTLSLLCHGRQRDLTLLNRMFRERFARSLPSQARIASESVSERRIDRNGNSTVAFPSVHITWFPTKIEIRAETAPDRWRFRSILPAGADGREIEEIITEAQQHL